MSSKFWVCIALLSVGIAHTYVYTNFLKEVQVKEDAGIAGYLSSVWPHVEKIVERVKDDVRTMLETGHEMAKVIQKGISDYREKHKKKLAKKNVKFT
ncbi:hypothetical protein KR044_006077 [Drosophila immigrans]|nr:hypothetical protein KR044_006077 [Drosophila immigrans]